MRIVREGWPFIIGCLLAANILLGLAIATRMRFFIVLGAVFFILTAFCAYFFRDPLRVIPQDAKLILSPADGLVVDVSEGKDPSYTEPVWVLRIFLSVFNAHLQRTPIPGKVRRIEYKRGKFLDARHPQAHFENEQNRIEIDSTDGKLRVVVTQIAGLIARRIVCWVREGQDLKAGERIGLIRFGSQVDVVLPKSCQVTVKKGDVISAGDTVIAKR